jgi:hypothetical protein
VFGSGSLVDIIWPDVAINSFSATMATVKANGWIVTPADLPFADWATMAAGPPGPYYVPALSDPLFDLAP